MGNVEKYLIKTNKFRFFHLNIHYKGLITKQKFIEISFLNDNEKHICNIKVSKVQDLLGKKLIELESSNKFKNSILDEFEFICEIYQLRYFYENNF